MVDAVGAADRYKRARDLMVRARADLVEAAARDRAAVNISGLSRRAGLHETTLQHWVGKELKQNGNGAS